MHRVDAVGIDHVGIGSATEMLSRGFTPADIAKFGGGNYCRVFDRATSGRA